MNFNNTIKEISELTDINDHCSAYVLGATLLESSILENEFIEIRKIRDNENGLDYITTDYRYHLYIEMMRLAKEKLSDEEFAKFYGAF